MESLNRMAVELVDEAIDFADELNVSVHHLENDAVVLDFGVTCSGGIEAGLLLTEIQTGGLATVQTQIDTVDSVPFPFVDLSTDQPVRAVLSAQSRAWHDGLESINGTGSGPAQLLSSDSPDDRDGDGTDGFDLAVLVIEAHSLPSESTAEQIAATAGVAPSGVFMAVVPPGSIAGSVLSAARAGAITVQRLVHLGYPPDALIAVNAQSPVPPVTETLPEARRRARAGLALAARVHLLVAEPFDGFDAVPFDGAAGEAFDQSSEREREEETVRPAQVTIDVRGGPTRCVGSVCESRLRDVWV